MATWLLLSSFLHLQSSPRAPSSSLPLADRLRPPACAAVRIEHGSCSNRDTSRGLFTLGAPLLGRPSPLVDDEESVVLTALVEAGLASPGLTVVHPATIRQSRTDMCIARRMRTSQTSGRSVCCAL